MKPARVALGVGVVAGALCAVAQAPGCSLYPELTRAEGATTPRASDCASCHVEQHAEWKVSAHARAFTAPAFVEATNGHAFGDCLGCHAPGSLYDVDTGPPTVRLDRLDDGVDCQACHLDHGKLVGPVDGGALLEPHPVRIDRALYTRSDLCGRCHEGTFAEWRQHAGPADKTCQACHMTEVTRTVTQATDTTSSVLVAFEDTVQQRRHTFDVTSVDLTDAFALDLTLSRGEDGGVAAVCSVTSRVPHLVPTGDFGFRQAELVLEGRDAAGASTGRVGRALYKELGTALAPGEPLVLTGALPARTVRVEAALSRAGRAGERRTVLARTEQGLERAP